MKNHHTPSKANPILVLLLLLISQSTLSQAVLYNPQELYDEPGGLFDQGIVRDMNVQFYDNNYHNILVNSFFINPSYRIPAQVTIDGQTYDSVAIRYKGNSTFCLPNDEGNFQNLILSNSSFQVIQDLDRTADRTAFSEPCRLPS